MDKKGVFILLFVFILLVMPLILAQDTETNEDSTDDDSLPNKPVDNSKTGVENAYLCLEGKVANECDSLTIEEQIFSLLALSHKSDIQSECKSLLDAELSSDGCWPKNGCNTKTTAQATLAYDNIRAPVEKQKEWLLSQKRTPENLEWFLQIDSNVETSCSITYSGSSNSVSIGGNKKLGGGAGSCLTVAQGGYWLKIGQSCLETEFSISCDQSFISNLLYKKTTSPTIYVSESTHSASPDGTTKEQVESFCLKQNSGSCDYEATLWGTLVLDSKDRIQFLPYLIAFADDNSKFLPESFIYSFTNFNDFFVNLIKKQKQDKFWDESGDKYYDTAVALLPFQRQTIQEKTNSLNWLLEVQDTNGCWQGNIRNTAFLLYSGWPKTPRKVTGGADDGCEDAGFYCMSPLTCQDLEGDIKDDFDCIGTTQVCCTKQEVPQTCAERDGIICLSGERCGSSGLAVSTPGLGVGEICCLGSGCVEAPISTTNGCEDSGRTCRIGSCEDGEQESDFYSCPLGDTCCEEKKGSTNGDGSSNVFLILLIILIILIILGIIFRNKLRPYWFRLKSRFSKGKGQGPKGMGPPPYPSPTPPGYQRPPVRRMPYPRRRILPPGTPTRPMLRRQPGVNRDTDKQFQETLEKLKKAKK
jgi:hypothetical protein